MMSKWRTTPKLIAEQRRYRPGNYRLRQVPLDRIEYISFGGVDDEYSGDDCQHNHYVDHHRVGHDEYIKFLAGVMQREPMAPALGFEFHGNYIAQDGNHRINAAIWLGINIIPMLMKVKDS